MANDTRLGWNDGLAHTEFCIGKAKVASINHKDGTTSVDLQGIVKTSDKNLLVRHHQLSMQVRKKFLEWKPWKGKDGSASGPARKKDWYGEHDGADSLDEYQRKSVARKLKKKGIDDLDF